MLVQQINESAYGLLKKDCLVWPQVTLSLNLRQPGANSEWIPGGYLPTGYSEAVINNIPKGKYIENSIK
ncbi:MAG: hypothetical protein F8N35_04280 [Paludibacter sp.]|nr:hypothetical protein [Paludibacter sp.]